MDPVVDRSPWLQSADVQLMFDCIPVSFVDKLNQLLEKKQIYQLKKNTSNNKPSSSDYLSIYYSIKNLEVST